MHKYITHVRDLTWSHLKTKIVTHLNTKFSYFYC